MGLPADIHKECQNIASSFHPEIDFLFLPLVCGRQSITLSLIHPKKYTCVNQ